MTTTEIAAEHGVSRQTIHTYRRTGVFPSPVEGEGSTRPRFREDEVIAFFEANPKQPRRKRRYPPEQQGEPAVAEQSKSGAAEKSARDNLYEMATVAWQDEVPPPVRASVTLMLDIHEAETAEALAEKLRLSGHAPAADLIDPKVTENWRP